MNFWSKASEMLWAGSVEIIRTDSRTFASWIARLQLKSEKFVCRRDMQYHLYIYIYIYIGLVQITRLVVACRELDKV